MNALTSFSESNLILRARIALLAFYGAKYSDWSEKTLVTLEYLQLISQTLLVYPNSTAQSSPNNSSFTKAVIYFFKLVNPSSLITFQGNDSLTYTILLIVLCCMLLKYMLTMYVVYIAYRNCQGNNWLLSIWRWIFRRQSRILYFFTTSFWTCLIMNCSTGTFTVEGMNKPAIIAISIILIAIEYAFSVILELQFCYVLPTKNFLASKTSGPVMITLNQKLVIQIVQLIFQQHFGTGIWIFIILNLTLNLIRTYQYYNTFPLYNLRALLFQGDFLSIVTSLNIACLFNNILQEADYQGENVNFIVIAWLILSALSSKLSKDYILRQITNLLSHDPQVSVDKLLHKVFALKQLNKRLKLPQKKDRRHNTIDLIDATRKINAFTFKKFDSNFDLITNENANGIYLQYFEDLAAKFPKESIIRLYIAKLCIKYPGLYPKAINIITRLAREKWSEGFLSACLLQHEIERKIMKSHHNAENNLDLLTYMKNQLYVDKLTKDILTQLELKITVCNNMIGEKSNIGLIFNNAQLISKKKSQIQKQIDLLPQTLPSCFIEPDLVCAGYSIVLDDSLEAYVKYNDLYLQKQSRYEKAFQELKLNQENVYQDTNAFLILSGENSNNGQIVYSSQSIDRVLGGKQISYNKAHISSLFPQSFQSFYTENFRQIFKRGKVISLNQGKEVFLQHKDGHIVHVELYVKIHPYLTKGLYLDLIIRRIPSSKEYLVIKEDGSIEGATKTLANDLRIKNLFKSSSTLPNIQLLSQELWTANQAFNTIAKIQSKEKSAEKGDSVKMRPSDILDSTNYQNALDIYRNFSLGKRIEITSLSQVLLKSFCNEENNPQTHSYDCSVSILPFGPVISKLIVLEKVSRYEANLENEYISVDIQRPRGLFMTRGYTKTQNNEDEEKELSECEDIDSPEKAEGESLANVYRPETNLTTHGNLVSPTNGNTTSRPFLLTNRSREEDKDVENQTSRPRPEYKLQRTMSKKRRKLPEIYMNPLSSNQPNSSSQSRTASATFKTAIAINFSPKSFTAICLMFYAVILVTFFSQVALKVVSDDIMATLTIKKNLLTYSQLRTYRVFLIASNARVGVTNLTSTGPLEIGLVNDIPKAIESIKNQTDFLQYYNDKMLDYASFLDDETLHQLFSKDIRIFDYNVNKFDYEMNNFEYFTYRNVTQFQAIDETIHNIYKLRALSNTSSNEAFRLFYFLRYNNVNDFLYKCEQITTFLTESVQNEREYLEIVIMLCLIIVPLLLLGIILMVTIIIRKQYLIEKKNMLAFIKLKPDAVKDVLSKLKMFKKNLQNKDYSEYQRPIEIDDESSVLPHDEPQKRYVRRRDGEVVNYSDMRKRYYGYFIKVTCYILVLIGIMVWNFVSAENANQDIYRKQNQVHFANRIIEISGINYMAFEDTFLTNNSADIKRTEHPLVLMIDQLEELKTMQGQISEVFLDVDRTYDPQVESHLYQSYCSQFNFTYSLYYSYCDLILSYGQRVNLVSLMAYHQDIMQAKLQDYYNCNKTLRDSLYACAYRSVDIVMPVWVLLIGESFSLGDTISQKLEQSINDANYQRNVFLIVFSVSLVVASLLIWYQILAKLKEGYNDFKKVLQLFPPALILSSFQLKTFLLQHSKQIIA